MHGPGIPAAALLVIICILAAGCTDLSRELRTPPTYAAVPPPSPTTPILPAATTMRTMTPVAAPPSTSAQIPAAEPIRPLPPDRQVALLLTKDRPSSEISLLYQGGPGDPYVQRIQMRVYAADNTTYKEYMMDNGRKPVPGDEIVAPGTRGGDRCEVFVISGGTRYKVMDEPEYAGMYY